MNLEKYRKFVVALCTAVVEGVALWANAPAWVVGVAGFAGALLVYLVPNEGVAVGKVVV